jgi:hypothetical protein
MTVTASGKILATFRSGLLVPSPTTISRSAFRHSSPTDGPGLLADADAMGSSTRRVGATTLWNTSVNDTALTYFHATHGKTSLCKFDPNIEDLLIFMKNQASHVYLTISHS